jgi:hypothetical protein
MDWAYALSGISAAAGLNGDALVLHADPITMGELFIAAVRGEIPPAPAAALALAPAPLGSAWRTAQSSWAAAKEPAALALDGSDFYMFTSAAASLGSSSLYYNNQDKQAVAQLAASGPLPAASPRLAQVTLVQDSWDNPYGTIRKGTGSGQDVGKPTHMKATVAAVQDKALLLSIQDLTMTIEASSHNGPFSSVATNVVFPAGAGVQGVYVDGVRVANTSAGAPRQSLRLGCTVAVRSAGGIVGWRVPFVDGLAGFSPVSELAFDGPAGTDAARHVTYLYRGANVSFPASPPPSRSITLMAVGSAASDAEAAAFSSQLAALQVSNEAANASNWRVTVQPAAAAQEAGLPPLPPGFSSTLHCALYVPNFKKILARQVNGTDMHMPAPGALELVDSSGQRQSFTPANS